jgi:hypothetical protein
MITFVLLLLFAFPVHAISSFFDFSSPISRLSYLFDENKIISNRSRLTTFFSFEQTFHNNTINKTLLGKRFKDGILNISGSQATKRCSSDLLADYFYLPNNFISRLTLDPSIHSLYAGIQLRQTLDQDNNRFFINFFIPIIYRKTKINLNEKITPLLYNDQDVGYFVADNSFTRQRSLESATDYFYGKSVTQTEQTDGFGMTAFLPLQYSKIKRSHDQQASIGCKISIDYEIYQRDNFILTVTAHSNLPVGLKPKGHYLLEGAMGTNPYWTLGGGLSTKVELFHTDSATFFFDGYIQLEHQFPVRIYRVFDLVNKPLSRYMLAQKLGPANSADTLFIGQAAAQYQFQKEFCPLANLTRLPIHASRSVICDGAIAGSVQIEPVLIKVGSTFTLSSPEKIRLEPDNIFANNTTWALKGDAQMYGFTENGDPIALPATENNATIFGGTNYPITGNPSTNQKIAARKNSQIDNKGPASQTGGIFLLYDPNVSSDFANIINGSTSPIFIKEQDLALAASQIQYAECSLFGSLTYDVRNTINDWQPSFSMGSTLLFGFGGSGDSHTRCEYRAWNMWLQATLSY